MTLVVVLLTNQSAEALRRSPRVYNALITTDQNISPSRSFPVIQPHLEYPAFGSSWIGNPYSSPYLPPNYYQFGSYLGGDYHQPHTAYLDQLDAAAYAAHQQQAQQGNQQQAQQGNTQLSRDGDQQQISGDNPQQASDNQQASGGNQQQPQNANTDPQTIKPNSASQDPTTPNQNNPDLSLNEFGLPPSLVPISPIYNGYNYRGQVPINLNPYQYNSYPLIYDQVNPYQPHEFLPPYGYYSSEFSPYGGYPANGGVRQPQNGSPQDAAGQQGSGGHQQKGSDGGLQVDGKRIGSSEENGGQGPTNVIPLGGVAQDGNQGSQANSVQGGVQQNGNQDLNENQGSEQGGRLGSGSQQGNNQGSQGNGEQGGSLSSGGGSQQGNNQGSQGNSDQGGNQGLGSSQSGNSNGFQQSNPTGLGREIGQNRVLNDNDQQQRSTGAQRNRQQVSRSVQPLSQTSESSSSSSTINMASIRNYEPMDRNIRDVPAPPVPRGAKIDQK